MNTEELPEQKKEASNILAVANPAEMMRLATDVAGVCGEIVKRTALKIKGKQYVKVEGWQSIATAHGCVAGIEVVEPTQTGFRAVAELRRIDNGIVIARAEGFVGDDEKTWAVRDEYARRAMAQTRAISRVCRSAFAHVVVLIDADLSTTPAEEMSFENGLRKEEPVEGSKVLAQVRAEMKAAQAAAPISVQGGEEWRNVVCTWGKRDGPVRDKRLGNLRPNQVSFLFEKFCNPDSEHFIQHQDAKDLPLVKGLIAWNTWRLEQAEKKNAFEQQDARHKGQEARFAAHDEEPRMPEEDWKRRQKEVEDSWNAEGPDEIPGVS